MQMNATWLAYNTQYLALITIVIFSNEHNKLTVKIISKKCLLFE